MKALTTDYNLPTENGPVPIVHCVTKDDSLPGERDIYNFSPKAAYSDDRTSAETIA